jgi:hypothetical protein
MRLENEPPSPSQQSSGVRLTASEMDAVLNRAIARESSKAEIEPREATLEDALEIARELGISEEQVRASLAEVRSEGLKGGRSDEKRAVVRARRRRAAGVTTALMAAFMAVLLFAPAGSTMTLFGCLLIVAGWLGVGWLIFKARFSPVTDAEADRVELPPVAGTCRVCGKSAYSPQSTFCEEHRYRSERS